MSAILLRMVKSISNLSEYFEHELKDAYDAETLLVDALGTLAREAADPEVKQAFESHREETRGHVARLEEVFTIFGKEPNRGEGCDGIRGILEEKKKLGRHDPAPPILQMANLTGAAKTERYEISVYESLIQLATELGLDDVVEILEQTLDEEEAALETVLGFAESELPAETTRATPSRNAR